MPLQMPPSLLRLLGPQFGSQSPQPSWDWKSPIATTWPMPLGIAFWAWDCWGLVSNGLARA